MIAQQAGGDQVPAEYEKQIDAQKPSGQLRRPQVVGNHREDGETAQPVQGWIAAMGAVLRRQLGLGGHRIYISKRPQRFSVGSVTNIHHFCYTNDRFKTFHSRIGRGATRA